MLGRVKKGHALLFCLKSCPHKAKTEVTLDRIVLPATKGHFCSVLVSNIFPYPLFPDLSFAYFVTAS